MGILNEIKPVTQLTLPVINNHPIRMNQDGLLNLNDLHKASGFGEEKAPNKWTRLKSTQELIAAYVTPNLSSPLNTITTGANEDRGIWAIEELLIDYAQWLSIPFKVKCIEVLKAYSRGELQQRPMTQLELIANLANSMVQQEKVIQSIHTTQLEQAKRLEAIEAKTTLTGTLLQGYVGRKEAHLHYCKGISYDTFRTFAHITRMPSEPYKYTLDGSQVHESVQYKISDVQKLYGYILAGATRISKHYYTHADFTGKFKISI